MSRNPRVFFDTSALFAGIWSPKGGARMLLRLGEAGAIQLLISAQVLQEIEEVIRRKAAGLLPTLAVLLDRSQASSEPPAPPELVERCQSLVPHPGDARILADAWHNRADYLVTLDRSHFMDPPHIAGQVPFQIGTPGDCLSWYRGRLKEVQDQGSEG